MTCDLMAVVSGRLLISVGKKWKNGLEKQMPGGRIVRGLGEGVGKG